MVSESSSPTPPAEIRRSRRMREADERLGEPVERAIRRLYLEEGLTLDEIATRIEVAKGTVGTWMVRFRITRRELVAELAREAS